MWEIVGEEEVVGGDVGEVLGRAAGYLSHFSLQDSLAPLVPQPGSLLSSVQLQASFFGPTKIEADELT